MVLQYALGLEVFGPDIGNNTTGNGAAGESEECSPVEPAAEAGQSTHGLARQRLNREGAREAYMRRGRIRVHVRRYRQFQGFQ